MVDDDDSDESPSLEPRTDSRSALPREIRAWRWLRIVKHDETFSLIFFLPEREYMELELRSMELLTHGGEHHEIGDGGWLMMTMVTNPLSGAPNGLHISPPERGYGLAAAPCHKMQ